jgi:hypothetical protein
MRALIVPQFAGIVALRRRSEEGAEAGVGL